MQLIITELSTNFYHVWYEDETAVDENGDPAPEVLWNTRIAIRDDQVISDVANELLQNWEQRGDPSAYVLTAEQILELSRDQALQDLRAEGTKRVQLEWPHIKTPEELKPWHQLSNSGINLSTPDPGLVYIGQVFNAYEAAAAYIRNPARTLAELQDFDAVGGPSWPVHS